MHVGSAWAVLCWPGLLLMASLRTNRGVHTLGNRSVNAATLASLPGYHAARWLSAARLARSCAMKRSRRGQSLSVITI